MSPRQPGRRLPAKSHGMRAPSSSGRPPTGAPGAAAPTPPPAGAAGDPAANAGAAPLGATGVRPGSRSANRAAKRASTTGVRPKTQVRKSARRSSNANNTGLIVLALVAVVAVAAVIIVGNPFGSASASPTPGTPVVYGDGTCPTAQPASLAAGDVDTVTIKTDQGDIVMKIDGGRAPIATGNFVALVKCHYYDGLGFHRLVPGFVIQGGDPDGTGAGRGPGYTIQDDPLSGTYHRGTVAMARTGQPNSQGGQFFIVLDDSANAALTSSQVTYPYAILGDVVSGMDVVDKIAAMANSGPPNNAATTPVIMTSVTVVAGAPATGAPTSAPTVPSTIAPTAAPSAAPAS